MAERLPHIVVNGGFGDRPVFRGKVLVESLNVDEGDVTPTEEKPDRDFSTFYLRLFKILFHLPDTTIAAGTFGDNP